MRMVTGSICRTKTGLNMRATPGGAIVATLVKDALVELLGKPVDGWGRALAVGNTEDGKALYFEPDVASGQKATIHGESEPGDWRLVDVQGAVAVRFLDVVDGPE